MRDHLAHLSVDVQLAARAIIEQAILDHPRSAQVEIGASEIGTPCTRKLAYKLSRTGAARAEQPAWRPTVGTAVHAWLEQAFIAENAHLGWDRWLVEMPLTVGDLTATRQLRGHCDIYDRLTGTLLDWKVPGVTTIKHAKAARSPGHTYRAQGHCYGLGWARLGFEVNTVAIYFLPAAGELGDGYYWSEPYDEGIALEALARARRLFEASESIGWDQLIAALPVADDYCAHCPWWKPGSTDTRTGCPGAIAPKPITQSGPAFGTVHK